MSRLMKEAEMTAAPGASGRRAANPRRGLLRQPSYGSCAEEESWTRKLQFYVPSFWTLFQLVLLPRVISAFLRRIADCDETYNYWEPLHLLSWPSRGSSMGTGDLNSDGSSPLLQAFQTWEYAPQYALRSWTYIAMHLPAASWLPKWLGWDKVNALYCTRMLLAWMSSYTEARLIHSAGVHISPTVAHYMLLILLPSAGMFQASTALLPSTLAMYTTTLAASYAIQPSTSACAYPANPDLPPIAPHSARQRSFKTIVSLATGAVLGWPFALVLSLPFVVEELFLPSGQTIPLSFSLYASFVLRRLRACLPAIFASLALVLLFFGVDTAAYGRPVLGTLNIIIYNIFSAQRGAGPELYGTEDGWFYFRNLSLLWNPAVVLLALASWPLLLLIRCVVPNMLLESPAATVKGQHVNQGKVLRNGPFTLLLLRITPFNFWFMLMSLQAHKEERFIYPAYPLLAFNAAVGLYLSTHLARSTVHWLLLGCGKIAPAQEVRNSASNFSRLLGRAISFLAAVVLLLSGLTNISRSAQSVVAFKGPVETLEYLEKYELPSLIVKRCPAAVDERTRRAWNATTDAMLWKYYTDADSASQALLPHVDLEKLRVVESTCSESTNDVTGETGARATRLCYGKEWHRFPSHFHVPAHMEVRFIKSAFEGILPQHFIQPSSVRSVVSNGYELEGKSRLGLVSRLSLFWPWRQITSAPRTGFNDLNREEIDRYVSETTSVRLAARSSQRAYSRHEARRESLNALAPRRAQVDVETCDYLIDVDFPHRHEVDSGSSDSGAGASTSTLEPRYAHASSYTAWKRLACFPFLDAEYSRAAQADSKWRKVWALIDRAFWLPSSMSSGSKKFGDYCLLRNRWREAGGT